MGLPIYLSIPAYTPAAGRLALPFTSTDRLTSMDAGVRACSCSSQINQQPVHTHQPRPFKSTSSQSVNSLNGNASCIRLSTSTVYSRTHTLIKAKPCKQRYARRNPAMGEERNFVICLARFRTHHSAFSQRHIKNYRYQKYPLRQNFLVRSNSIGHTELWLAVQIPGQLCP